jgi:ABC-2 type transport system permease protein
MQRLALIGAIFSKDARLLSRDRFSLLLTGLGLVFYVLIFWLMPSTVDETVTVGLYQRDLGGSLAPFIAEEQSGLRIVNFASPDDLEAAVRGDGEVDVDFGLAFPPTFLADVRAGRAVEVRILVDAQVPPEIRETGAIMVRELAYALAGERLPVSALPAEETVLGDDRAGNQAPLRDRMLPLLVFVMLLIESFALGALIANEIQSRTVAAITITRATTGDFLLAKTLFGTALAFSQGFLLLTLIGGLGNGPMLLIVTLLLGALLATAVAFVAGSSGKEFMTVIFINVLLMIPLMIPMLDTMFPGAAAPWVQALPSYGLVQTIVGVTAYGDGWRESLPNLGRLLAWCAVLYVVGLVILKRRVENL